MMPLNRQRSGNGTMFGPAPPTHPATSGRGRNPDHAVAPENGQRIFQGHATIQPSEPHLAMPNYWKIVQQV